MSASPASEAVPFSVLVLISASPLQDVAAVLADLPAPLPVPVLITTTGAHQGEAAELEGHVIQEAHHGTDLTPGRLYVTPPTGVLELQPGLRCTMTAEDASTTPGLLDTLLTSLARSAGQRVLLVVLGSLGPDQLAGLRAVLDAGGTVLVEQMEGAPLPWPGTLAFSPVLLGPVIADLLGLPPRQVPMRRELDQAAAVLERMGDAHCLLDGAFVIRSVNAAAERLLGMSRDHLIGRSHWEAFPASVDAPIGQALRQVVQQGDEQHLTHHYTGEGYDLHLEVDAYPTGEGGVSMFWRDVTARVRSEAALRDSEGKYRALFTEMDEAYAVVEVLADETGRWVDFLFLDANPVFMRHTGMPYPVGRTARELLGTPNPRWAELYGQVAETGVALRVEEGEVTLGRVFDLNIFRLGGAGSRRVAVLFTDITERKLREAHQAFLLDLTEALSVLSDEADIVQEAGARLVEHLHLSGYHYVDVDDPRAEVTIRHSWHALDVPALLGTYPIAGFMSPDGVARLRAGEPNAINDVLMDVPDDLAGQGLKAGAAVQKIRAYVAVPFSQDRRWNAYFAVADSQPRVWSASELELIRDVARLVFPRVQRARALRALQESEERFTTLFSSSPVPFMVLAPNAPDYTITTANEAYFKATRTTPESLIGRRLFDIFTDDPARPGQLGSEALDLSLQKVLATRRPDVMPRVRYDLTVPGGYEPHWWEAINAPLLDASGNVTAIIHQVMRVTELHLAQEVERQREQQGAYLLRLSDALRALSDAQEIEDAACRVLGEWLGAHRVYYVEVHDQDGVTRVDRQYLREGAASIAGVYPIAAFDWTAAPLRRGEAVVVADVHQSELVPKEAVGAMEAVQQAAVVLVPLLRNGAWVGVLAVGDDVPRAWTAGEVDLVRETLERLWASAQRARAEAAVRASQERFHAVANLVPDLLWESGPDGFTHWYNQQWLEYTGQTFEQATGWGWTEAIHEVDRERSASAYREAVESGRPLRQEHRIRRHDGAYRWFVVNTVPVRNEGGEVLRVYGAATDIHALRLRSGLLETLVEERSRQLAELNSELEARTRALEAFGELTRSLTDHLDPYALVRRAQELVMGLLPEGFAAYYEPDGDVWHLRSQVGDMRNPALQAAAEGGLAMGTVPSLDQPWTAAAPLYQEHYAPDTDGLGGTGHGTHMVATIPLVVESRAVGVFAVALFEQRSWSGADRAVLETLVRSLGLALEPARAVQALAEEREALAAFVRFTELTADTGDVVILAQRAAEVLHATLNVRSAVYFQQEGERWKAQHVSGALAPEFEQHLREGVPQGAHTFTLAVERREPMFFEPWDAAADGLSEAGMYQAVARYPLFPPDQPVGVLGMAITNRPTWSAREKAVFRAVGDSFRLALERAAQVQQIAQQRERLADLNAELGNVITRTAHNLEAPAQRLSVLLNPGAGSEPALDDLPPYDPALLQDEITRLRGVAQDLRQLSSLETHVLASELLPLGELFTEVRDAWAAKVESRRVDWFVAPLPIIQGDQGLLRQALDVLMTFTLSPTRGARYVTVDSRAVGGEVQVVVQDDGVGLVDEEAATLFDLAVRSDQGVPVLEGGGLMQVRRIPARHGGWAWAETAGHLGRVVLAFPQDPAVGEVEALFGGRPPSG
jgi:PAS domain S-box-containing protein